jgi:hypothetical protein
MQKQTAKAAKQRRKTWSNPGFPLLRFPARALHDLPT